MPITKQELQRTYSRKSTTELLAILEDRQGYTPLAHEVAHELICTRRLYKEDVEEFMSDRVLRMDDAYRRAHFVELPDHEKALLYFLSLIMLAPPFLLFTILRRDGLLRGGYALKLRQAHLFIWSGFFGLLLMGLMEGALGTGGVAVLCVAGFIGVYLWDRKEAAKRKAEYDRIYGHTSGSGLMKHEGGVPDVAL